MLLGSLAVVAKFAMGEIPPGLFALLRAMGAAILLQILVRCRGGGRVPDGSKGYARLALFGLLGVAINQLLYLYGLSRTTATTASILVTSIPIFTAGFAVLLKVESLTGRRIVGGALALTGVLILLGASLADLSAPGTSLTGNLMVVANTVSYGLYLVLSRPMTARMNALTMAAWIFTFGCLGALPFGVWEALTLDFGSVSPAAWAGAGYAVFSTALGYWLVLWALRTAGPTLSSLYVYVQPVVVVLLATIFLGERLTAQDAVAAALIFTGVYLAGNR